MCESIGLPHCMYIPFHNWYPQQVTSNPKIELSFYLQKPQRSIFALLGNSDFLKIRVRYLQCVVRNVLTGSNNAQIMSYLKC